MRCLVMQPLSLCSYTPSGFRRLWLLLFLLHLLLLRLLLLLLLLPCLFGKEHFSRDACPPSGLRLHFCALQEFCPVLQGPGVRVDLAKEEKKVMCNLSPQAAAVRTISLQNERTYQIRLSHVAQPFRYGHSPEHCRAHGCANCMPPTQSSLPLTQYVGVLHGNSLLGSLPSAAALPTLTQIVSSRPDISTEQVMSAIHFKVTVLGPLFGLPSGQVQDWACCWWWLHGNVVRGASSLMEAQGGIFPDGSPCRHTSHA